MMVKQTRKIQFALLNLRFNQTNITTKNIYQSDSDLPLVISGIGKGLIMKKIIHDEFEWV